MRALIKFKGIEILYIHIIKAVFFLSSVISGYDVVAHSVQKEKREKQSMYHI